MKWTPLKSEPSLWMRARIRTIDLIFWPLRRMILTVHYTLIRQAHEEGIISYNARKLMIERAERIL